VAVLGNQDHRANASSMAKKVMIIVALVRPSVPASRVNRLPTADRRLLGGEHVGADGCEGCDRSDREGEHAK